MKQASRQQQLGYWCAEPGAYFRVQIRKTSMINTYAERPVCAIPDYPYALPLIYGNINGNGLVHSCG